MLTKELEPPVSVTTIRRYRSPLRAVYNAWTQPDVLSRWLVLDTDVVESITADVRVGGAFRVLGCHEDGAPYTLSGRYTDLAEHRRLVFSWLYDGPRSLLRGEGSLVTVDLRPITSQLTECTVTHEWCTDARFAPSRALAAQDDRAKKRPSSVGHFS